MNKYIGKKLEGRYELLELIGFGGMAIVFKAFDILEGKHVAVKILKDEFLESEDFKRRFRNESKAIAVLSHPSIVKVLDVCFNDTIQYIVMEYIDGITLKEYIEQQGVVKWKEAVHFSVQILRALQHAHDNGIVHRDVKPQNVMLLEDGTIKVMDFGIARFARENGKTMSDKAIGSVHYISPEQAKGDTTDERTDIYAVGVIIYEMLTGKVPFDGESAVSIAIKQMQIEPQRPRLINPDIPAGLEEIILRAMQKDAQLRYQTASEMLRDIDEFKKNPSVVFEYKYMDQDGTTKYFEKIVPKNIQEVTREEAPVKKSYVLNILAGVTVACVIVSIVAVFFFFKVIGNKTPDYVTINVIGMTVEEAAKRMPDLNVVIIAEELSEVHEKGIIMKQDPAEGMKVKGDSDVKVTVSLGLQAIVVPDVIDDMASTAKQKLIALGLDVEQVSKADNKVASGHVIETQPPADTELQKGDTVTIFVSAGAVELPLYVPDIKGLTDVEARTKLAKEGFKMGTSEQVDSDEPAGTIVDQTPEAETRAEKGSSVNVKVSNGMAVPPPSADIAIDIPFPNGETGQTSYIFEVVVNGESLETIVLDVTSTKRFYYALSLQNGLINGKIQSLGGDLVTVKVDGAEFASYLMDLSIGSLSTVTAPNFSLLFPFGYTDGAPANANVSSNGASSTM